MKLLSTRDVVAIHGQVIDDHELQGLTGDKSIDAILYRVESRIQYGLIGDVYDLAATYAAVIAVGHAFNEANKRTTFVTMNACLRVNGITLDYEKEDIGQAIIAVAQGKMDEIELARYLRGFGI